MLVEEAGHKFRQMLKDTEMESEKNIGYDSSRQRDAFYISDVAF